MGLPFTSFLFFMTPKSVCLVGTYFSSVQFTRSVMSNSLRSHEGTRQASLSIANSWACSNSYPSSQWCHPTISSSVMPFSAFLQSFPGSGSFLMSPFSASGGQIWELQLQLQHPSFQWIFRADFLQDGLVWSPCSPGDSQESFPTPQFKNINSLVLSFLFRPTLTPIHDYWNSFDYTDFGGKVMSLLFNMMSIFFIAFFL